MGLSNIEEERLKEILVLVATGDISFDDSQNWGTTIKPPKKVEFTKEEIKFEFYAFRPRGKGVKIFAVPKPEMDCYAIFKFNVSEGYEFDFYGMFGREYQKHPNYLGLVTREYIEDYKDFALSQIIKNTKNDTFI